MRARLLTTATLATAGLLLAGCGGGEDATSAASSAATSAPAGEGSSAAVPTATAGTLVFPDDFGLPSLTVPDDARVVDYSVTDDLSYDVSGLSDTAAVLESMQAELTAAGFQVDRTDGGGLGISITASKAGAGSVLVQQTTEDAVTVIGQPPA